MPMHESYSSQTTNDVIRKLGSSAKGLSNREAEERLARYGHNELKKGKRTSVFVIFLNQFKDFLIILLLVATAISIFLGEYIDASAIFAIVLLSAILGFFQEYNAEKAIEALKKIAAPMANVIRDGKEKQIAAGEIVPGDIILLESGDIVPADGRIIEAASLKIDEASLTGESLAVEKTTDIMKKEAKIADQKNMAFMSSIVAYGKGKIIATATGMETELGKIAKSLESTKSSKTPLQYKFEQMAKQIGIAVIILVAIVFATGLFKGGTPVDELFIFALSLAVAAVPSSLPAIVTIGLSLGAKTLAKNKMIIKKLHAAESLGSVTIICSDKTGTLTKNQMTITDIFAGDKLIKVSGSGYDPKGEITANGKKINREELELFIRIGRLCNNSRLLQDKGKYTVKGDPTEGSLVVLARKAGFDEKYFSKFAMLKELPFDSERKMMTVVYKGKKTEAYVKGAPDLMLNCCDRINENGKVRNMTAADRKKILAINTKFAERALRVLGLAYKEVPKSEKFDVKHVEQGLIFVGLAGMIDPPRQEVEESIKLCKEAGIRVMMITGDHAITAKAVAEAVGLFKKDDLVLTGEDVEKMDDKELAKKISKIRIIARALPIQKSRIVDALKKNGHVVAMTGDGVNDAPALKKADIGIAMGITGTDVAKEVSKGILVDDNFATIVNAVSEGRNIYDKIIKSTRYLLSCNAGEIVTVFFAIMMFPFLPLLPLQILLMNLITDGLPALGLSVEKSDSDVMTRPPRDPREKAISGHMIALIAVFGLIMGAGTLYLFNQYFSEDLRLAQTVAFTTLVMFEMFAVMGSRSFKPFEKLNPFSNMWLFLAVISSILIQILVIYWAPLQLVFNTVPLTQIHWLKIILVSSIGFLAMEIGKFFITVTRSKLASV